MFEERLAQSLRYCDLLEAVLSKKNCQIVNVFFHIGLYKIHLRPMHSTLTQKKEGNRPPFFVQKSPLDEGAIHESETRVKSEFEGGLLISALFPSTYFPKSQNEQRVFLISEDLSGKTL